ncbi:MAG: ABC transporter ATP-binding protein [Lentisphaeraceae bacterium]|nr:ABC transporter ATP-binding protein [Lentisphaeraceae bacterium]
MIEVQNLTKSFGGGRGVHDLSMEVPGKSILGFIGPNGAGKSTTIKLLCGLLKPDSGSASIDGIDVTPSNYDKIKRTVGYMPDIFGVYDKMSVWEYLDFFGAAYKIPSTARKKRIEEVLELVYADHMIDYQVASLSRGMTQKIGLAKTMLHDPKVLILDEPAGGLDPQARIEMREIIVNLREIGKTVMLSSHILPELGTICDLVTIVSKGKLRAFGTVEEVSASLKETLRYSLIVDSDPAHAAGALDAWENISDISTSHNEILFTFDGARTAIADVVSYLVQSQARVVSISEEQIDLESVFMQVTSEEDE